MQTFSVHHELRCPNGELVVTCHNDIRYEIIHLVKQDFSPNCICGEPLIHLGHSICEEEVCQGGCVPESRGVVSISGLWVFQLEEIIDIRFGDSDADSWKPARIDRLLVGWDKIKKDKYG